MLKFVYHLPRDLQKKEFPLPKVAKVWNKYLDNRIFRESV